MYYRNKSNLQKITYYLKEYRKNFKQRNQIQINQKNLCEGGTV